MAAFVVIEWVPLGRWFASCCAGEEASELGPFRAKTWKSIFEFFGDLSKSSLFVFCKLQGVLLHEFGDLILRVCDQKWA